MEALVAWGLEAVAAVWPVFVAIIGVLAFCGVSAALYHTGRYKGREARALVSVKNTLARIQQQASQAVADDKVKGPRLRQLISPAKLLDGLPPRTLIAERLTSIDRMLASQVKLSVGSLQQMTLAKEATRPWLALPGLAANISMLLGLFGTVVGLEHMVQQIGQELPTDVLDITRESWKASLQNLHEVLSGMRTAFVSTMAGVGAAILLAWLNHRLARSQSMFIAELDRFTTEALLPAVAAATEDQSLLEQFSLRLESGFAHFDTVMQTNRSMLQELHGVEQGLVEIVNSVRQTVRNDTPERVHEVVGKLGGLIGQMATLNQTVLQVSGALPKMIEQLESTQRATLTQMQDLRSSLATARPAERFEAPPPASPAPLRWPFKVALAIVAVIVVAQFL